MKTLVTNNQTTKPTERKAYEKPITEIIRLETNMPSMVQTSYHYEPGWDD